MGRQYFCEFCQKSFKDNPTNRRNHMKGVQHIRLKKMHYDMFRDPATMLAEEASKAPCRVFMQTGECKFGNCCKFSHMTAELKHDLEQQILVKKAEQMKRAMDNDTEPSLDDWLQKRLKTSGSIKEPQAPTTVEQSTPTLHYVLPPQLAAIPNLPPSLLPPPLGAFINVESVEWG